MINWIDNTLNQIETHPLYIKLKFDYKFLKIYFKYMFGHKIDQGKEIETFPYKKKIKTS